MKIVSLLSIYLAKVESQLNMHQQKSYILFSTLKVLIRTWIIFLMFTFIYKCESSAEQKICTPSIVYERQPLNRTAYDYRELESINSFMTYGSWNPKNCQARQKVALIVPYRDRETQLKIFLLNVLPKLYRQNLDFTVYVIEQEGPHLFNKGALMNIGFLEAMKHNDFDCIIFHDVDILPEDDRNLYICGENPRHLTVLVQQFNYRLFHSEFLGGVTAFTEKQFKDINGFSNLYQGWGSEDDDAFRRIKSAGYRIDRPEDGISFSGSIKHSQAIRGNDRCSIFFDYGRYWQYDGLNSINYMVKTSREHKLYHWLLVNFDTEQMRKNMKQVAKSLNSFILPRRHPSFEDGFCNWFLNEQLFKRQFVDNICEIK